jgi:signal transduction histidine kinase/ABC-type amino acid transport substrate-binding protein
LSFGGFFISLQATNPKEMKSLLPKIFLLALLTAFLPGTLQAQNDSLSIYTQERKLIYEDAWDLWPYAFLNEHGVAEGFNIELVRMIMEDLNIPFEIKLKARRDVLTDMKEGRADLTMGMEAPFHDEYGLYGRAVIQLFTHSVVTPKDKPVLIHTLNDLRRYKVSVHTNSFSHNLMKQKGWDDNAVLYNDMKEAVLELSKKEEGQIVWNTVSLKWLIRMCQADNLQLTPVDMPHGAYRFMSHNRQLLDAIDLAFNEIESDNELKEMRNKWFYPERTETGIPSWIWYLAGGIAFLTLILLFFYLYYHKLERQLIELGILRNKRLAAILQTCHVRIWTYDVPTQTFTWMDKKGQPQHTYSSMEFAQRYHSEDFDRLCESLRKLTEMEEKQITMEVNANNDEDYGKQKREYVITLSVLRYENGKPSVIIGTKRDVTDEHEKQRKAKQKLLRYQSIFNTAMVDMVYFDENGKVADMNERAVHTFNCPLDVAIEHQVFIKECLGEPTVNLNDYFYATQLKGNKYGLPYYERQLVPVYDKDNKLLGIYGTGREVTEVVHAYHQIREGIKKLQEANKEAANYVNNINYVLGVGGVRLADYSPDTHTLTIYKGLNTVQLALTQSRCMSFIDDDSRRTATKLLNSMDSRSGNTIDAEIKTTIKPRFTKSIVFGNVITGMPLYLHFRFIPIYDKQGNVASYFGLCRDISEIKATEQQLEKETVRAQEVENLKNSFLRNMSYEIRTPLNAVVGFSELFEQQHTAEDEEIFIDEIRKNSEHLLTLINDILFLSRLDAHMIEISKHPVDFAKTFEGHCHIGWSDKQKEGVRYVVENHYEELIVDIDDTNMGRIIEQITANAAQHTDSGTVRARYDYIGGKLMIAIEDTGCGMSKDTLTHIYERFASNSHNGTGLGLPICKELAEQMGGTIDISSEQGKGTTIWITMPCTASVIERKKEI